jgi:hypothetical protein
MSHTDKKESKKIPHIKGNPEGGAVAKSNGHLIYD